MFRSRDVSVAVKLRDSLRPSRECEREMSGVADSVTLAVVVRDGDPVSEVDFVCDVSLVALGVSDNEAETETVVLGEIRRLDVTDSSTLEDSVVDCVTVSLGVERSV